MYTYIYIYIIVYNYDVLQQILVEKPAAAHTASTGRHLLL